VGVRHVVDGLSSTYNDFVPIRLTVVPVVFAVSHHALRGRRRQRRPKICSCTPHGQALALIWVALLAWGVYG